MSEVVCVESDSIFDALPRGINLVALVHPFLEVSSPRFRVKKQLLVACLSVGSSSSLLRPMVQVCY